MKKIKKLLAMLLCVILLAGFVFSVNIFAADDDSVTCTSLGTDAPSASLISKYSFQSFEGNGLTQSTNVSSIPMLYSNISTSTDVTVYKVPDSWSTWSNGFTGNVYCTTESSCTLTMPDHCLGAILYVESNNFDTYNFTVSAGGMSTVITEAVNGTGGAKGFAFVSNDQYITTITISTVNEAGGFAFGELYTSYGAIVSGTQTQQDSEILTEFSGILGVDSNRLSYQISTPSGETQTYPEIGAYDLTVTVDSMTDYTFANGLIVLMGDQSAPSTPVLSATSDTITIEPTTGCEYSLDNTTWQDSNVFSGLDMVTEYTVYMRYKETDTLYASPVSSASITTNKGTQAAPSAPVLNRTSTSITALTVAGCEYSLDNTTWQDSNVFSGLKADTEYTVYMRYKATDKLEASPASSTTIKLIGVPATGDVNTPVLYALLMFFSACAAMVVCMIQRKKFSRSDPASLQP